MLPYVRITVWSDYVCPYCYLEEPVFARLKSEFGRKLRIERRAFELRPEPEPTLDPDGQYLHATWAQSVYPMAEERGMTLRLPPVQPRSRKALEAERFARRHRRGDKMHQALFQAFFEHGRDIGELDELVSIGRAVGLNASRLAAALRRNDFSEQIETDRRDAEALGINGVPAILLQRQGDRFENARLLMGAQPYEVVERCVRQLLDKPVRSGPATTRLGVANY